MSDDLLPTLTLSVSSVQAALLAVAARKLSKSYLSASTRHPTGSNMSIALSKDSAVLDDLVVLLSNLEVSHAPSKSSK